MSQRRSISEPEPYARLPSRFSFSYLHHPLSSLEGPYGPGRPDPGFNSRGSEQPGTMKPLHQTQENTLPWVPGQEAIHQATAAPDDLAGHLDQGRAERPKFHPQQGLLFGPMLLDMPGRRGYQERGPSLQTPGQAGHDHVGPVADQVVHRGRQGVHPAFELGDQVLLVTSAARPEDDLVRRHHAIIGDEEEIAIVLEESQLSF